MTSEGIVNKNATINDIEEEAIKQTQFFEKFLTVFCFQKVLIFSTMLFNVGDLIVLKDGRIGEVRYVGRLPGEYGKWVGVFLIDGLVIFSLFRVDFHF